MVTECVVQITRTATCLCLERNGVCVALYKSLPIACLWPLPRCRSFRSCSWSSSSVRQTVPVHFEVSSLHCDCPSSCFNAFQEIECFSVPPVRLSLPVSFFLPPSAPCQPLLHNVRTHLRPEVRGTRWTTASLSRQPPMLDLFVLGLFDRSVFKRASFQFLLRWEV